MRTSVGRGKGTASKSARKFQNYETLLLRIKVFVNRPGYIRQLSLLLMVLQQKMPKASIVRD